MSNIQFPPRNDDGRVDKEKKKDKSMLQNMIGMTFRLFMMIAFFMVFQTYFFATALVSGQSMEPTLHDGDYLIVNKFQEPERKDVVIFTPPDKANVQYVKRIIGVPGDSVEYIDNELYINGEHHVEDYIDRSSDFTGLEFIENYSLETLFATDVVPEGHYFVVGDNRDNSRDSRTFGFIDEDSLIGFVETSIELPEQLSDMLSVEE